MQTNTEENYLKAIYLLGRQGKDKVSATILASSLGNNPASVIDMLRKLKEKKLVEYDKRNGARLTSDGIMSAIRTIRKHRLWEFFLQQKLDYTWDEVHDIAEQMEHVHEDTLADRLDKYLGYPQFDPHGEVIPGSDGQMPVAETRTLNEMGAGSSCRVVSVKDNSKSFLQYLHKLKIGIGTLIEICEKIDFDGSQIIRIEKSGEANVSEKVAENIFVR